MKGQLRGGIQLEIKCGVLCDPGLVIVVVGRELDGGEVMDVVM